MITMSELAGKSHHIQYGDDGRWIMAACMSCGEETAMVGYVSPESEKGKLVGKTDDGKTPGKYVPVCISCSGKVYTTTTTPGGTTR